MPPKVEHFIGADVGSFAPYVLALCGRRSVQGATPPGNQLRVAQPNHPSATPPWNAFPGWSATWSNKTTSPSMRPAAM